MSFRSCLSLHAPFTPGDSTTKEFEETVKVCSGCFGFVAAVTGATNAPLFLFPSAPVAECHSKFHIEGIGYGETQLLHDIAERILIMLDYLDLLS